MKTTRITVALCLLLLILITGCSSRQAPFEATYAPSQPNYGYIQTDPSNEQYGQYTESTYLSPLDEPLSTFSIDIDTASYSNMRRYLTDDTMPPTDSVRVEEYINYFQYDYHHDGGPDPVSVDVTISDCPWNGERSLARITLVAQDMDLDEAPPSNLVFLLDVSGSMASPDKLPLVKEAIRMLAEELTEDDTVSIVVYAGSSGVVLDGCEGNNLNKIDRALNRLQAGGSTAGGAGIYQAYKIAKEYFIEDGNNRVILCTDGDFNVGPSNTIELQRLIEDKRKTGVFLSVLGFGSGNYKDEQMETLADKGNGNYFYIDSIREAYKALVEERASTLYTIAKDVKIQVEFNPEVIAEYRLVGYDNRRLDAEDFNDDQKDAGEMGTGHRVTVFYELITHASGNQSKDIDDLVFQKNQEQPDTADPQIEDWLYVKVRYKHPDQDDSQRLTLMAGADHWTDNPDRDFRFASAVVEFALLLKDSQYAGDASYTALIQRAKDAKGTDDSGYRAEFIRLAETAKLID